MALTDKHFAQETTHREEKATRFAFRGPGGFDLVNHRVEDGQCVGSVRQSESKLLLKKADHSLSDLGCCWRRLYHPIFHLP